MDIAKRFKPNTILLWKKIAKEPEAQRILDMFKDAEVRIIEQQRVNIDSAKPPDQALLDGKRTIMIGETSSFVGHFNGDLGSNIHCQPYYKLVPISNGCPYYCTYCYLAFVYRKFSPFIKININYDTMFKQIRKTLKLTNVNATFNMGEMLDSLALDHITNLIPILVPFFSSISRGFLMLLTKSSNIDNLLAVEPNDNTIVSWSLNSRQAIKQFEPGTADLDERIEAARLCQNHGYRIRFRIDPGILYPGWQNDYTELITTVLNNTNPQNITLGMLRLLPAHFQLIRKAYANRSNKLFNQCFHKGATDGKLRYSTKQRLDFYKLLINTIRSINRKVTISLCRETPEIWKSLNCHCEHEKCNCMIW